MIAVVFDMDGVIFDSEILVLQAWKEVAERHGIAGVEAACHECLGTNSVVSKGVFLKHYGEDFPYEEYKAEMAEVFFSHASGGKLAKKPGVEELLKYLKMRGFKIGLASSTREVLVRSEISDGGLLGYFDQIIGGDMVERSKPEPDIFLEAARRLGEAAAQCTVIEDSPNGLRASKRAGCRTIFVPDLWQPEQEQPELYDARFSDLDAVRALFAAER